MESKMLGSFLFFLIHLNSFGVRNLTNQILIKVNILHLTSSFQWVYEMDA